MQPTTKALRDMLLQREGIVAEMARGIADFVKYREKVAAIATLDYAIEKVRGIHHALFRAVDDEIDEEERGST